MWACSHGSRATRSSAITRASAAWPVDDRRRPAAPASRTSSTSRPPSTQTSTSLSSAANLPGHAGDELLQDRGRVHVVAGSRLARRPPCRCRRTPLRATCRRERPGEIDDLRAQRRVGAQQLRIRSRVRVERRAGAQLDLQQREQQLRDRSPADLARRDTPGGLEFAFRDAPPAPARRVLRCRQG